MQNAITDLAASFDQVVPQFDVNENERVEELEAIIRSLREEVERLKAEISRLRRDRDERPPHYL